MTRPELLRRAFYVGSTAVVLLAALLVPMPLFTFSPGTASSIPPLIAIEAATTAITGDFGLLTVTVRQPSLTQLLGSSIAGDELRRLDEVLPSGLDRTAYFEQQARVFDQAFDMAITVGLRAAGEQVDLTTAALVVDVVPGAPASDILQPNDIVVTILGVEVSTATELVDVGADLADGQPVPLTVERDGELVDVVVKAGEVRGMTRPGLGVSLDTIVTGFILPFDVSLAPGVDIGGPSAGLMIALSVYDLVAAEDLSRGRRIVGTGTMDLAGEVGPIGSIEQKVEAAVNSGAQIFLAPAAQAEAAAAVAPPSLRVIPVATFEDALAALRALEGQAT